MTLPHEYDDRARAFTEDYCTDSHGTPIASADLSGARLAGPPKHMHARPLGPELQVVPHLAPCGFTEEARRIDGWIRQVYERVADVHTRAQGPAALSLGDDWATVEMTDTFVALPRNVAGRVFAQPVAVEREFIVAPVDWYDPGSSE